MMNFNKRLKRQTSEEGNISETEHSLNIRMTQKNR